MTWSVDSNLAISDLLTTIASRLVAGGWTLTDRTQDGVWQTTNSHNALCLMQITNCQTSGAAATAGANRYLQFQGWRSWNTGTHAGADGSGTTYQRLYYANADCANTVQVKLSMSVTAHRAIILVEGGSTRNWVYMGGLAPASPNDPGLVVLMTGYQYGGRNVEYQDARHGSVLQPAGGYSSYWTNIAPAIPVVPQMGYDNNGILGGTAYGYFLGNGLVAADPSQVLLFSVPIVDGCYVGNSVPAVALTCRGLLDGMLFCPIQGSSAGHGNTLTYDDVTYYLFQPCGPGSSYHVITGNAVQALAVAEV